jgi:hypothetical protein
MDATTLTLNPGALETLSAMFDATRKVGTIDDPSVDERYKEAVSKDADLMAEGKRGHPNQDALIAKLNEERLHAWQTCANALMTMLRNGGEVYHDGESMVVAHWSSGLVVGTLFRDGEWSTHS